MKSGSVPTRLTRVQVQEKFKKNFQALCAKCPQLARNHDSLDDSLTSLQWLWNLNVNISNPTDQCSKTGPMQRNSNLLPPFPRSLLSRLDKDVAAVSLLSSQSQEVSTTAKINAGDKSCTIQSVQALSSSKTTTNVGTGHLKGMKNGKKPASYLGNPSPPKSEIRHSSANSTSKFKKGTFSTNGSVHDVIDSQPDDIDLSNIPHITISNSKESDTATSDVSSPRNYSFSPRETMLDLLPGQVDYKNNPYVKPTFSFTSLICMAIQSNKNRRMSQSGVCKWITDNFMYYRYADPGWQGFWSKNLSWKENKATEILITERFDNVDLAVIISGNSIKLNLIQSKYFNKVNKKKDSANCLWEIKKDCDVKHCDVTASLANGNLQDISPQLACVDNNNFPRDSLMIPLLSQTKSTDNDDNLSLAGRKRKQASPQKLVRRRSGAAKKRRNAGKATGNQNLLKEEAPELGSLKGDFNWNTIFDEFFGANDTELSLTPASVPPKTQCHGNGVNGPFADDVVSGSLLAHDLLVLPDLPDTNCSNSVKSTSSGLKKDSAQWQSPNDCNLHPTNNEFLDHAISSSLSSVADQNINEFMKEVEFGLTVTSKQVDPSTSWLPECSELEELLNQNTEVGVGFQGVPPEEEIERLFLSTSLETSTKSPSVKSELICPTNSPADQV